MKPKNFFTPEEREARLRGYVNSAISTMRVCRHSGIPETGLLIGRSLYPMLIGMIHRRVAPGYTDKPVSQQLEELYSQGIIDDAMLDYLRRAGAALGDFGSGRDIRTVLGACESLRTITRSAWFKDAPQVRPKPEPKEVTETPRRLSRWASAAAGLFSIGS